MSPVADGGAVLVLEDGVTFRGEPFGGRGEALGEAVFATGMTGYQETLTDPSYQGQIVVMTAPHVGNTGVNDEDAESGTLWPGGYVVRDPARVASSWRARRTLADELADHGVVGIKGVDTRAVTRHLRERGAMRAAVASSITDVPGLLHRVRAAPAMTGADLTSGVSTPRPYVVPAVGPPRFRVVAVDLGVKAMSPRLLAARGAEVHVLPAHTQLADVLDLAPDGVFLSNGPGDPATADHATELLAGVLARRVPVLGICFGHQVFGRALGRPTYKLRYGHRGLNQPVLDLATGAVAITAHNHGFAVDAPVGAPFDTPFGPAEVTHVGLNDGVVEGLRLLNRPAFSVQYHPEAAAGPHDAAHLFDQFVQRLGLARGAPAPGPEAGR